jgi:hypothetical protein
MNRFSSSAVRCSARNLPTSWRSELAVGHGTLLLQVRPDLGQSAHPNPILKGGESCPAVDNMHAGRPRVYGARVGICARNICRSPADGNTCRGSPKAAGRWLFAALNWTNVAVYPPF